MSESAWHGARIYISFISLRKNESSALPVPARNANKCIFESLVSDKNNDMISGRSK